MNNILPAITHIVNLSIENGKFPTDWKIAKILPLHKKNDQLDPKNYRPVAILPILSKVLEKAIFIQVSEYMSANDLLHRSQHGFRRDHSTTTGLIEMYDKWVEAVDKGEYCGACFLDLSAAFDIVDHSLLVEKMKLYGFNENSLTWVTSYLTERSQRVYLDGFLSDRLQVPTGVPQGSILGPLFYIIYTNEIPEVIHSQRCGNTCQDCGNVCSYADDSTLTVSSVDCQRISSQLEENFVAVSEFMLSNKLKLNGDKTHLMMLATENAWRSKINDQSISLNTGQETIHCSKSEILLGGLISADLKWSEYILHSENSLVKKLSFRLSALKNVARLADFRTRKMIANGLFISKLIYLMPVWGGCDKYLLKALQLQQNKAARLVTNLGRYTPIRVLLHQCGWLSVHQLVFYHTVVLLYKVIQAESPKSIYSMIDSEFAYETRSKSAGKLKVQSRSPPRLNLCERSFRWRSVMCWNQLPSEITSISKVDDFKKHLKLWVAKNIPVDP